MQLMRHAMPHRLMTLLVALMLCLPGIASAQSLFSPVIRVNESVITGWELQQRQRLLRMLGAPNPGELAREQLIEDRLKIQAAAEAGIVANGEVLQNAMAEFAGRRDMTLEAFTGLMAEGGVAIETLRDFLRAGVVWRELVQARFGARAVASEDELDRALASGPDGTSIRVALSEIIIPIPQGREADVDRLARQISELTSISEFAAAARRFSAARTREQDGRVPWRGIADLPPNLQERIMALKPGEVTSPLALQGAVALFQLRAIEEVGYRAPPVGALDYMTVRLPGGHTEPASQAAAQLARRADRCDDLFGLLRNEPAEILERHVLAPNEIPRDIRLELSRLDPGETSAALTRDDGQTLLFLMLCTRVAELREGEARETLARGLRNQRLETLADSYLAQLRAEAQIRER